MADSQYGNQFQDNKQKRIVSAFKFVKVNLLCIFRNVMYA